MKTLFRSALFKPFFGATVAGLSANIFIRTRMESEVKNCIIELKDHAHLNELIQDNKCVILDFYAEWCPPCIHLLPVLEHKVNEKYSKGVFSGKLIKINLDNHESIADFYEVIRE